MSSGDRARLERLKSSSERGYFQPSAHLQPTPSQRPLPSPPGRSLPQELNGGKAEAAPQTTPPTAPRERTAAQASQQTAEPPRPPQKTLFIKPKAFVGNAGRSQSPVGRHRRSVTVIERPTHEGGDMDSAWKRFDFDVEPAAQSNRSRVDRVVVEDDLPTPPPNRSLPAVPAAERPRVERVVVGDEDESEGPSRSAAPPIPSQPSPTVVPSLSLSSSLGATPASPPEDSQFPPVPPRKGAPKRCLPPTPGVRSGGQTARNHEETRSVQVPPRRGSFDSADTTAHVRTALSPPGKTRKVQKAKLQNVGARYHQLPTGEHSGVPASVSCRPLPSVKSPPAVRARPLPQPQPKDPSLNVSPSSTGLNAVKGSQMAASSSAIPRLRERRSPATSAKKRSMTLTDLGDLDGSLKAAAAAAAASTESRAPATGPPVRREAPPVRTRSPTVGSRPQASTPPRRVGEPGGRGDPLRSPPKAKNFMRSPDTQKRGQGGRPPPGGGRGRGSPAGAPVSPIGPPMRQKQLWRASTEHRIANAEAGKHTLATSDDAKVKPASSPLRYAVPTIPGGAVFPVRASTNCLFTPVPTSNTKSTENAAAYNREIRAFLQNIHNFQVRQHLTARVLRGGGTQLLKPVMGDTAPAPSLASLKAASGPEEEPTAHPMQPVWDRWIELEEEERNVGGLLCMTMSDGEDALPIIKGGVVEQLVERLTHAGFPDPEYVTAFLLTYRSFIEPEDLMDMLIKNFTVPEPASHKDREFLEYFHDTVRKPIQFRGVSMASGSLLHSTFSTFKMWVEKHWYDFENNPMLVSRLRSWLSTDMKSSRYQGLAKNLEKTIMKKEQGAKKGVMHIRQDMPTPIVPKPGAKFIDFSPIEVARQICLIEFQDYKKIHPTECMHQSWTKKNKAEAAPSIGRMIKRSNSLPLWVATQILSEAEGKLRNRAKIVSNFIKIASELRKVNNFNAVMEITAGLQLSPIYRLKKTWELVPKKLVDVLEELQEGFKSNGNWRNYRNALRQCAPPCLPYLGLYLTDLTFIEDGHPDELATEDESIKMVNFLKCRQLAVVIREIQQFQQCAYAFEKVDVVYDYLQSLVTLSEEELFELSLEQEPREE